ncbi:GIY-YIG nuclease family protein [Kosakonia sp. H02]|nr:GIY-YIG nuclease family protein [Kosakonia sp. H02]
MHTAKPFPMQEEYPQLQTLDPLANAIIEKTVDNVTRKLVAGYRNKNNSRPNASTPDASATVQDTLAATSAQSVLEVANRGANWKELILKTFSHGISSISTMKFDGEFTVKNGKAEGLDKVPDTPGVYVVFDNEGQVRYIGDAAKLQKRWVAGHLNENKQAQRNGESYKLADEFAEGCTVKFISVDSVETAAAIEAHILKTEMPPVNKKEELKYEQGKRSNIEAKKMKESLKNAGTLAVGAAKEAGLNVSWEVLERLVTTMIKALKDEMVDLFITTKAQLKVRLKRFFDRIWQVLSGYLQAPLSILKGIFEFVVNALSQAIGKIYQLAKNIYELGMSVIALMKGAKTVTRDEMIHKASEVIITSGALIFWDALDPLIEAGLTGLFAPLAPFAPYISSLLCAVGFGVTSYYLTQFVPQVLTLIANTEPQFIAEGRKTHQQLLANVEANENLLIELDHYARSSLQLMETTRAQTREMNAEVNKLTRFSIADELTKLQGH